MSSYIHDLGQRYASLVKRLGDNPWMSAPFVSSATIGAMLSSAAKIVASSTPFWSLFQTTFVSCTAVHSAIISPLQSLPTKRNRYQSLIKSTLHIAWSLRTGVITALAFDFLKPVSIALMGENKYLLGFWDIASIVAILPIVANPMCSFATGTIIVGGVAVASLASKYVGEYPYADSSREPVELTEMPVTCATSSSAPQQVEEPDAIWSNACGRFYFRPPGMIEVSRLVEKYQVEGNYEGISYGRPLKIKNLRVPGSPEQPCDAICLLKGEAQIKFEQHIEPSQNAFFSTIFQQLENIRMFFSLELIPRKRSLQLIENRIRRQNELAIELNRELENRLRTIWQNSYSSFLICGENELIQLGYFRENAQKMHALFLFYKPLPQASS